jgi:hypothetical protein
MGKVYSDLDVKGNFIYGTGSSGDILVRGTGGVSSWTASFPLNLTIDDFQVIDNQMIGSQSMSLYTAAIDSGSSDDGYYKITTPFVISFMGQTYSDVYLGTNAYVTFGGGSSVYNSLGAANPALPGIFINSRDRYLVNVYTKTESNRFIVRYEGYVSLNDSMSYPNPEVEFEISFYTNGIIDVNIGNNYATLNGLSCIKTSSSIKKTISAAPNTGFRLYKGYGYPVSQVVYGLNYKSSKGLSYSISSNVATIDFSEMVSEEKYPVYSGLSASGITYSSTSSALKYGVNVFSVVSLSDYSTMLPDSVVGGSVKVINRGSATLSVYPGASSSINLLGNGEAALVPYDGIPYEFICIGDQPGIWSYRY